MDHSCSKCGETKPVAEFVNAKGRTLKTCRVCCASRLQSKQRREEAQDVQNKRSNEHLTPHARRIVPRLREGSAVAERSPDASPTRQPTTRRPARSRPPEPRRRGIHSSDDEDQAKARRDRATIKRRNRLQRRDPAGQPPLSTPPFEELVELERARRPVSPARVPSLHGTSPLTQGSPPVTQRSNASPLSGRVRARGADRRLEARNSRARELYQAHRERHNAIARELYKSRADLIKARKKAEELRKKQEIEDSLRQPVPPIHADGDNPRSDPALSDRDWSLLQDFHNALGEEKMETCVRCKERWFNMRLDRESICARCVKLDKDQDVHFFSHANCLDPGGMPAGLPELTQIEEMLIARVHPSVEVRNVRGAQFRYTGHVVNFMRDVARVYDNLPLLPRDLDVIVLRPSNADSDGRMRRQFRRDFRVRIGHIRPWLLYLKEHHPGYRDIQIDEEAFQQLKMLQRDAEGSIMSYFESQTDEVEINEAREGDRSDSVAGVTPQESIGEDQPVVTAAVPNLLPDGNQLDALRRDVNIPPEQPRGLSIPRYYLDKSLPLLSLTFPTLFPNGDADIVATRRRSVEYKAYVQHLVKYEDARFARHPRFRFVVFNTMMRHAVNNRAGFYVRRNQESFPDLSINELRTAFEGNTPEARRILRSIVRCGNKLRGTRPYWTEQRQQLEAVVEHDVEMALFITLSAADYHWDSLQRHMPRYSEWRDATGADRIRIARTNLVDNPHIAAYHFHRRTQLFRDLVLTPKFNVLDYWGRYEWQGRGSGHNHCVYSCGPPCPRPQAEDEGEVEDEKRRQLAKFWSSHIMAINPDPGRPPEASEISPMSLPPESMENSVKALGDLVRRLQHHECSTAYCLRKKKNTQEMQCRFYFPHKLRAEAVVVKEEEGNPKFYKFLGTRNDPQLNQYNPLITLAWLANIDITALTGSRSVINYIAKYVAKPEKKSLSYDDLMKDVLRNANPGSDLGALFKKLLNKLIAERDWSSQEIFHLLLDLPLVETTRTFQTVDLRPESEQSDRFSYDNQTDDISRGRTLLEKYVQRDKAKYADVTYLDFVRNFDLTKSMPERRPKADPRILRFFPRYDPQKNAEESEKYARAKMMLHHPFYDVNKLLERDGRTFCTFREAYDETCRYRCTDHKEDFFPYEDKPPGEGGQRNAQNDDDVDDDDEDEFEDYDVGNQDEDLEWQDLANQRPGHDNTRDEDYDDLGERQSDWEAPWGHHAGSCDDILPSYWKVQKENHPADLLASAQAPEAADTLSTEQRTFYNLVMDHYRRTLSSESPEQLLLNLDGPGGTGKTYAIEILCAHLQALAESHGHSVPVLRAGPTGISALNVKGRTLHTLFRLPLRSDVRPLSNAALMACQSMFEGVRYLIIDEKSMIGLRQLRQIQMRCAEIFPNATKSFGGLNVILAGDFCQLPPVGQRPLFYYTRELRQEELFAHKLYREFNKTIVLTVNMRQQGLSEEAQAFRKALGNLRDGKVSEEDWKLLSSRCRCNLPFSAGEAFKDAIRIYPTKDRVKEHNHEAMRALRVPVVKITAADSGERLQAIQKLPAEDTGGLEQHLCLSIGSRVMLTQNLWTERGLVNGALGTVQDIVWPAGATQFRTTPPHVVLVEFDKYEGPVYKVDDQGRSLVPILLVDKEFTHENRTYTRRQFPLMIAYAITVHKSQGLSLDKAVLNIAKKDFSPGLTYVAVSRVKTLQGILFDEPFDFSRFNSSSTSSTEMRNVDKEYRAAQMVKSTDVPTVDLRSLLQQVRDSHEDTR